MSDLTPLDGIRLTPEADIALNSAVALTGENRATAVNSALRVYAQLLAEQNVGTQLALLKADGQHERLTLR